jgi:hypothetical protein
VADRRGAHMRGKRGPTHPAWKGGRYLDAEGYVWVQALDHPWPRARGYIREHVRVIELELGRRLRPGEAVHHRDGDKTNNDRSNLELVNAREHVRAHRLADTQRRTRDARGRFA